MANPFRIFRRHQKALFAVLGIMVMFAFVVLPIYMQSLDSQKNRNPLVLSTTRYGNIDEVRLRTLRANHSALEQFFNQLARMSQQAEGEPSALAPLTNMLGSNSERGVIDQWLLASRAEELGLNISDDAIADFLKEALTRAKISNEQVNTALGSLGLSQDDLFRLLRKQFLVQRLGELFGSSLGASRTNPLGATTPEQRWDYYQRLHRRAAIQVAGLPVSNYTGDVGDPGDKVLKPYFEKYKSELHNPALPTPGFKEPKRVAFEYLKADYNKLTALAKVSEEEIQKYYNEHKDLYKQTLPELPAKMPLTPPALPAPVKPAVEKPAKEKPAAEKPAKAEPAKEKPAAEEPAADKPASSAAKKSSALRPRSPFQLTAYFDDSSSEKQPAKTDKKPEEKPAAQADKKPAEKPEAKADKKPEAKPAAKTDKKPEEKPAAKAEKKPVEKPAGKPAASGQKKPAEAAKKEPPPRYTPLEKVRDEIRRQLADEKVRKNVHDLLEHLRQQLQEYHGDLAIYESQAAEENAKPPVRPDFKELAKKSGLEARDSGGLLDVFQTRALDIGGSLIEGRTEFVSVVYQKLPEFLPRISMDLAGNQYLFWKTKETAEKVPEWTGKGVRDQVLAAWKLEQARSIAEKDAERLARIARQSKLPLEKVLVKKARVHVYQSDPFTWLTEGGVPGAMSAAPPEISPIRAAAGDEEVVQMPGNGFMRAVFHRERGDVGVAMNQPETTVYVFRVTETTPASWDAFVGEGGESYSLFSVAYVDTGRVWQAWRKSIEEAAGVKWEREPVEVVRGEE
jgi:hypothetical protein